MTSVRFHREEWWGKPHRTDLQSHTLPTLETISSTPGKVMPVLCDVFRKGSAAHFAGEVEGVKMGLNLGFEIFGCFVSSKLWGQFYSDFKVLWQHLPGHYKPLILVYIFPQKCDIFKKSGNSPQYEKNSLTYFFWVGIYFCCLSGSNVVRNTE